MEYGITLPTIGPAASPEAILRAAEGADHIGLHSVWANERVFRPHAPIGYGGNEFTMPEALGVDYAPLETLAHVAARTERVRLGTSVLLSLLHSPALLAGRLATLDRLSGGRVIAGLGIPMVEPEYAASDRPFADKAARFTEFVAVLRAMWGPDPVRHDGRFYRLPDADAGPKPVSPGGPPILVGAAHPASIRRAARLGLGLLPQTRTGSLDDVAPALETFREAAAAAGRTPGELPVTLLIGGAVGDDPTGERPLLGTPERIAEELPKLAALGVTGCVWSGFEADRDALLERMERLLALVPA